MNKPAKHKLAMVDLDGTLVFTQAANHLAYDTALREVGFCHFTDRHLQTTYSA